MARPFLKWAGGKTQLLDQFEKLYPAWTDVKGYVEPFVGSGAVFFHVRSLVSLRPVTLVDGNADLINVWHALQKDVDAVIALLAEHKKKHGERYYYQVRAQAPEKLSDEARAARLIYLNKTCFNGLYRVNSRGQFNVPLGRYKNPPILDEENLRAVSAALKGARIEVADFRSTPKRAKAGDFVYLDPPYDPVSDTAYFTSYSRQESGKASFGPEDQAELAKVYRELADKGCRVMLSNSDTPRIRDLYSGYTVHTREARRNINSRADRRGPVQELVILNYDADKVVGASAGRRTRSATARRSA